MNRSDLLLTDAGMVRKARGINKAPKRVHHIPPGFSEQTCNLKKQGCKKHHYKSKMNHFSYSTGTLCADQTTHLHEKGERKNTGDIKTETERSLYDRKTGF